MAKGKREKEKSNIEEESVEKNAKVESAEENADNIDTTEVNELEETVSVGDESDKEMEALKETIETLENDLVKTKEQALRIQAETENFKKRMNREKEDFVKFSSEKTVKELLPVVDNLERAVLHAKESGEEGVFLEGVEMTLTLFQQTLEKLGVTPIAALGETFNPERHEAVQQVESADHEPNVVVSEFQKGYMLNARLIRPAMVVVSKAANKE